ncbi:MAG: adenosylmethionine--8-amino-7-oxononanoate transaminase, partial [Kiritimatiellae bacterium]|nr:adenosylmethionine--8-amino-7-oxononanoate transaminase [Kiritimatiellia bacterium]
AISSWWGCSLGHSHPRIVAAIKQQSGKLQHSILGNMSHPPAIELAERLGRLFKDERRAFFASDGASAVEAALKIAVQYWHNTGRPERRRIVSLANAYHGDTLGAVAAGFLPQFHRAFKPLTFPVYRAAAPFCAACARNRAPDSLSAPACDGECFQPMRRLLDKHHEKIAAVIVEPLCQCAAGMRIYSPQYLKKLAALCRAHDILLIADEIAVGFGRTGRMFAFEHSGIAPDIVCLGKGLSGGSLPISATVVKEKIYASFADGPADHTFYHGHTFAGNPLACAVALEVLKIYEEEKIVAEARRKGKMMKEKMAELRRLKGVGNLRGLGMLAAFDLEPAGRAAALKKNLLKKGVLIRPLGNTIYLMPPLNTPDKLLAATMDLLAGALEKENSGR